MPEFNIMLIVVKIQFVIVFIQESKFVYRCAVYAFNAQCMYILCSPLLCGDFMEFGEHLNYLSPPGTARKRRIK
jgi:hypothetical protein